MRVGWITSGSSDEEIKIISDFLIKNEGISLLKAEEIFDYESHVELHQRLEELLEVVCRSQSVKDPIRIVWSNSLSLNAMAGKAGTSSYVIVINFGNSFILSQLFNSLMALPSFWSGVGDARAESAAPLPVLEITSTSTSLTSQHLRHPNCFIRSIIAKNLTMVGIFFLLLHEFTHIANGHVENCIVREISEDDAASGLPSHTLEMDADSGAIRDLVSLIIHNVTSAEPNLLTSGMNYPRLTAFAYFSGHDPTSCTKFIAYCVCGVMMMFGGHHMSELSMFDGQHPHPIIRTVAAASVAAQITEKFSSLTYTEVQDLFIDCRNEVLLNLGHGFRSLDMYESFNEFSRSGLLERYLNQLQTYWSEKLHPLLDREKLTSIRLAPP